MVGPGSRRRPRRGWSLEGSGLGRPGAFTGLAALTVTLLATGAIGAAVHSARPSRPKAPAAGPPPTPVPPPTTTRPGRTCPGPVPGANRALAHSLIAAPARFQIDQATPAQEWLNQAQVAALSGPKAAGVRASLTASGFVAGFRRLYFDRADGVEADVRVYEFACREGASEHLALQSLDSLGTIEPATIPMPGLASAIGWAAAGPNSDDVYEQAAAATVGQYYSVVYTFAAVPLDGSYTASLLEAEAALLRRWSADPAAGIPPPGGPPAHPALLTRQAGEPPLCPAAATQTPVTRLETWLPVTPAGFHQLSDSTPPAGPVTISQLSATSLVPALAAASNRAEGYEGGFRRVWERADGGAQLQVEVESFNCTAGAAAFLAQKDGAGPGVRHFAAPESVPGGLGLITTGRNPQGHYRQDILGRVGRLVLIVSYFTSDPSTATLSGLLPAMVARLQAGGQQ